MRQGASTLPKEEGLKKQAIVKDRAILRKLGVCAGLMLATGLAFLLGRSLGLSHSQAQSPFFPKAPQTPGLHPLGDANSTSTNDEYSRRVVAYVYDTIPITRVELAEFLIARFGAERLEFLVNRKIVDLACQKAGIKIQDVEIEAQLQRDMKELGISQKEFSTHILKRFNKSLYEWKEDVIRPKLAMARLVTPLVTVTREDLEKGFEGRFGEKVKCRMVVYEDKAKALRGWERIKGSINQVQEFLKEAESQFIHHLAATKGEVPPIHKHFGDPRIEREAFALRPGEISQVLEMPDRTSIILMCEQHIARDPSKKFEEERLRMEKEIFDLKLAQKIPEYFAQLRKDANARLLLTPNNQVSQEQLEQAVQRQLNLQPAPQGVVPASK